MNKAGKQTKIMTGAAIGIAITAVMGSCTPVKEYQKSRLNDGEMVLGNRKVEKTELSFQSYREGASGANAGKSGGGCGCN
jgi:Holliday junction resolvasome RuvABC endonuclease subunit